MSTIEDRIHAFEEVQRMTYRVTPNAVNDCNCVTKSQALVTKFDALGLQSRYSFVEFSWRELGLPDEVLSVAHDEPGLHQHLEVYIPETSAWSIVDPTWDPGLRNVLQVASWDGVSSTDSGVPVLKTLSTSEVDELFEKIKSEEYRNAWFERNNGFLVAFNSWLEESRAS